jgi:uncharacterized protein (TIGR03382 family)
MAAAVVWPATSVHAGLTVFTSYEAWSISIGGTDAKIGFDLGSAQEITSQYSALGVQFASGTTYAGFDPFLADHWKACNTFQTGYQFVANFDTPQFAIGFDLFLKPVQLELYSAGNLVYTSPALNPNFGFRGVVTTQSFDKMVLKAVDPQFFCMDNMYVGNPVPGPGAIAVAMAALAPSGRRRRR